MGASRKLRRKAAREKMRIDNIRAENRVEVDRYKEKLYDGFLSVYLVNVALAVYDVYGNMPTRIQKIVQAFNERIMMERTLEEAQQELYEKTGIHFTITD